ncbi:MAG: large subunit ribosomal protein L4 [Parvibaculaceae bacterium]|jgi:large subunit ribosomal protein L4|nr:50S ribosomal protein L4 [Parvibaculaceae bacterium]
MKADVTTLDAGSAGSVELPDAVFGLDPRKDILQRMVTYQLAKRQQGTHKTKGRSEITGTTKKFVNQKGSGGARHGNRKVPQFRGGGKAFGPVVRSHAIDLPKKVRALALKHALSSKVKEDNLIILDDAAMAAPKTAELRASFGKLGLKSALVIGGSELDANFELAARNIPLVDVLPAQGINVYDILRRDKLVLTKAALESLEARFK